MVNSPQKFAAITDYIEAGEYFTINRARQFGKTTTLDMIWRNLSNRYVVVALSFEGVGDTPFESVNGFVGMFSRQMANFLESVTMDAYLAGIWRNSPVRDMEGLSDLVTAFTSACDKPVILTIDEVDKSSENQIFLSFLGMLRNKFLARIKTGMKSTFHNVILAGVYDIKNLKLKIRPDVEKKYNSPWNIAADFTVDMTFHPEEIARMLCDYQADVHTGMDIKAVSEEIYRYTSGYPFLVSYICKLIDEQFDRDWSVGGILKSIKYIVKGGSTLMDDLAKNLENNPEFRQFMYSICINSESYSYSLLNPMVNMGNMFSYIKERDNKVVIHNLVFEEALYMYFTIDFAIQNSSKLSPFQLNYIIGGHLNLEYALERFSAMMHEEYRAEDEAFLERQGRLVFLSFLKPIINGTGFYYVEPQTRNDKRMDLIVTYGQDEFIIELKIWRGEKYERSGEEQLAEYLDIRGKREGYLITFDFSKNKNRKEPAWVETGDKRIFKVVI